MGFEETRHNIYKSDVSLVVLSEDISERSERSISSVCEEYSVPVLKVNYGMPAFEFYLGKRSGIIGIKDKGFSEAVKKCQGEIGGVQ